MVWLNRLLLYGGIALVVIGVGMVVVLVAIVWR
jgi:hypothetical protein